MVSQATPKAPISQKVYGASGGGLALGLVTWALTTFIPAWHSGIPVTLQPLIPALVGVVGAFLGGWLSKHRITPQELQEAVNFSKSIESIIKPVTQVITVPAILPELKFPEPVKPPAPMEPPLPFDPTPGEPLPLNVVASGPEEHPWASPDADPVADMNAAVQPEPQA
jgi:hypothetical protein